MNTPIINWVTFLAKRDISLLIGIDQCPKESVPQLILFWQPVHSVRAQFSNWLLLSGELQEHTEFSMGIIVETLCALVSPC